MGITEKERREYKLYDLVPDFILPESESAVFNFYTYKGNQIDTSEINISDSFERICRIGYKHQNVFVIKMLEYMQKDGLYTCLNQIRIPLKGA